MNLILSPHNVTLTKAIRDHVISRINKLEHLNKFAVKARVSLEHDNTRAPEKQFSCSIRLNRRWALRFSTIRTLPATVPSKVLQEMGKQQAFLCRTGISNTKRST